MGKNMKVCVGCSNRDGHEVKFNKRKSNYVCLRIKQGKGDFSVNYWCSNECYTRDITRRVLANHGGVESGKNSTKARKA